MSDVAPHKALPDLDAIEADLDKVGRALARLDDGSYGQCVVCGEQIDESVLVEGPLIETCERHDGHRGAPGVRFVESVPDQTASESGGVASI